MFHTLHEECTEYCDTPYSKYRFLAVDLCRMRNIAGIEHDHGEQCDDRSDSPYP